jgi:hypothetical protein
MKMERLLSDKTRHQVEEELSLDSGLPLIRPPPKHKRVLPNTCNLPLLYFLFALILLIKFTADIN